MTGFIRSSAFQRLVLVVVFLVSWEAASGRVISRLFFSSPSAVVAKMLALVQSGVLIPHSAATFSQTLVGFLIGFLAGIAVGNIFGLSRQLGRVGEPILTFFYSLPRIAIAPLFVIWFGIDFQFKVAFVAFVVFFIGATATFAGLRDADRMIVDGARVMGARGWQLFRMTILPQEVLWITTSIKLALPLAIATDIVAEFVSSNVGLGFMMSNAAAVLDTTTLLAVVAYLALVVTVVLGALARVEARLLRWHVGLH
jgi:NitT/TauT family transport system permease protein